jgi:hypothetical protein
VASSHPGHRLQVLAASVVEDEVLKRAGLTALNIEATQRQRAAYRTPEAQGKAERLMDIVGAITRVGGWRASVPVHGPVLPFPSFSSLVPCRGAY